MFKKLKLLAMVASATIGSAVFAEETHSPKEWLTILAKEELADRKADPNLEKITIGAGFSMVGHNRKKMFIKKHPARIKEYVAAYKAFLNKKGYSIIEKLANGIKLSSDEEKYKYISAGCFVWAYGQKKSYYNDMCQPLQGKEWKAKAKAFFTPIKDKAIKLIKECYSGKKLTRKEIDCIRYYLVMQTESCFPHFLANSIPYFVLKGKDKESTMMGEMVPNMQIAKLAPIFKSQNYTDIPPLDNGVFFRSEGLKEIFSFLEGVKPIADGDLPYTRILPVERLSADKNDYVDISSFIGKKPVVLLSASPFDSWCISMGDFLNNTYEAYKDKVEFFIVNTVIEDIEMGKKVYYGDHAGESMRTPHPRTIEERARQTKVFYMENPFYTMPFLQDDMAKTTQDILTQLMGKQVNHGGSAATFIIDIDGRLVYPGRNDMSSLIEAPYIGGSLQERDHAYMDYIEQLIPALLKNDSKYDEKLFNGIIHHKIFQYLENMKITSIDKATNSFNIKGKVEIEVPVPGKRRIKKMKVEKEYTIKINPNTRITEVSKSFVFKNNKEGLFSGKLIVGNAVCVAYKTEKNGTIQAGGIHLSKNKNKSGAPKFNFDNTMKISGFIKELNKEEHLLSVQIPKPKEGAFIGYYFWKEAGDKAKMIETSRASVYLSIVKKIVEGTDEDRTLSFYIDDEVDIVINGKTGFLKEVKQGDHIGVQYRPGRHNDKIIFPEQIRINGVK